MINFASSMVGHWYGGLTLVAVHAVLPDDGDLLAQPVDLVPATARHDVTTRLKWRLGGMTAQERPEYFLHIRIE
jgi:hypothetical protein